MSIFNWLFSVIKSLFTQSAAKPVEAQIPSNTQQNPSPSDQLEIQKTPQVDSIKLIDAINFCIKPYESLRETNGKNRSPIIDKIITNHGGALGSAYCCYGVQQLLDDVVAYYKSKGQSIKFDIPKGGSTQNLWALAKAEYKQSAPKPASLVVWRHMKNTSTGHIGTCLSFADHDEFKTFEFNTSPDSSQIVREGEGAYYRNRPLKDVGDMHLLGFIDLEKAIKKI